MNKSDISDRHKKNLIIGLKRIEGQVRGIARMVEEERLCTDVLMQLAAVKAGINRVGMLIIETHTRGCISSAMQHENQEDNIEELFEIISKFLK